jgi:conjugative transfer signal peptidase TraF
MGKITQWLLLILSGLIILNLTGMLYFNIFTHSLPYGIYLRINGLPRRGDYAASCLSREIVRYGIDRHYLGPGNCDTGTVLVLKMIKGIPGDPYAVHNGFLELNGYLYAIMRNDSSGRILKVFYNQKAGVLDKGKYILLSDFSEKSWDSRYWGPVSIQFLLKPLWMFE